MSIKNIATTANTPASSLYVPANKSAPKMHTIIVIINFVNKFKLIIRNVLLLPASKESSQLHIKDLQGVTPLLYSTKIQLIFITAKHFTRKINLRLLEKI